MRRDAEGENKLLRTKCNIVDMKVCFYYSVLFRNYLQHRIFTLLSIFWLSSSWLSGEMMNL